MKKKEVNTITVGLFGTCGNSQWRKPFIEYFEKEKIAFFNPVVPDWDPSCAEIEAEHLVEDEVILFPVTDETYGEGSLAETGFSIAQAIRSNSERFVVIYVAPKVNSDLEIADPNAAQSSNRMRALVLAHMKKQQMNYPNVYIVDSMEKLLEASKNLYTAMVYMKKTRQETIV